VLFRALGAEAVVEPRIRVRAEVHPPERREEAAAIVAEMIAGRTALCSVLLMAKDGTLIPVETRAARGWDGSGQIRRSIETDESPFEEIERDTAPRA
jgi:hypothetical protein